MPKTSATNAVGLQNVYDKKITGRHKIWGARTENWPLTDLWDWILIARDVECRILISRQIISTQICWDYLVVRESRSAIWRPEYSWHWCGVTRDSGYSDDDCRAVVQPQHPQATEISQDTAGRLDGVPGPPWWHRDAGDSGLDDNEETHAAKISPDHEAPGRMARMMTDLSHPEIRREHINRSLTKLEMTVYSRQN